MKPSYAICLLLLAQCLSGTVPALVADENEPVPHWIWGENGHRRLQSVVLARTFPVTGPIAVARLRLTADFADCSLYLNSIPVARVDNFGPALDLDVAQYLRSVQDNTIELRATGSAGPAAIALSLTVSADGKSEQTLVTNASWTLRDNETRTDSPTFQTRVVSYGRVNPLYHLDQAGSGITAFDDYTQWKLAQPDQEKSTVPEMSTIPGFEVELLRKAKPSEGSWVSMAFDRQGRLTIAGEDRGLLRLTLTSPGESESLEVINDTLAECRGLLYAYGDLYANANNSRGLYRLHDSTGDDKFDDVQLLREFPGGVGHGRNDLALGPDGMIYSIHGDSVELPLQQINDLTSPFRDGGLERPQPQGHLIRTDRNGRDWELVATGLRNPFGVDFNVDGELFTYDADAEFDMGAPWYRPTRIVQLVSGADFGWRGLTNQWPPYQLDHADNALPTGNIGKGSPTAVRFGTGSSFPPPWRDALFVLDWAYGRIVACHLFPRGAAYICRRETFVKGRPLNVTDLDFGPDGAMYIITGGRKTESSLYRVRWTGPPEQTAQTSQQQWARTAFSAEQRTLRRQLEQWHKKVDESRAVEAVWPHLSSADPCIRQAARVALEHQPVNRWQQRALTETDPATAAVALLALSRVTEQRPTLKILAASRRLRPSELSDYDRLTLLQALTLCLADTSELPPATVDHTLTELQAWLAEESQRPALRFSPTGSGGDVVPALSRLVMQLDESVALDPVVQRMKRATSQEDQIHYLFLLRNAANGWRAEDRQAYFEILNELERTVVGGDGMPGFLQRIRRAAVATLSAAERNSLTHLIQMPDDQSQQAMTISRPHVRDWGIGDIDELLATAQKSTGSVPRGKQLFHDVLCIRCHRVGERGGVTGPDLTSVSSRFSRRDILKSVMTPSEVVAEKYRTVQIVTRSGRTLTGRVLASGDYRSPTLRISTDPLNPAQVVEIAKTDVEIYQQSTLSPMPKGLLNTLTNDEINDLLAYLLSAGAGSRLPPEIRDSAPPQ